MKKQQAKLIGQNISIKWLSAGLLTLLLALAFRLPGDPDMGWHLRSGADLISRLRFPSGDPYSWTMPGFDWVSHEWLMDVLMAVINNLAGLWGLAIIFTLFTIGIFYFAASIKKTDLLTQGLVAVIALSVSWNIIGARPQMMTLLGLVVVLYILFRFRDNPKGKLIYWLPVIFLAWANLHGGFAVGFFAIAVFVAGEWIRRILMGKITSKKYPAGLLSAPMFWKLCGISVASVFATLINPSGWGVYRELYQTLSNSYVLDNISEWTNVSLFSSSSRNLLLMSILLVGLLIVNKWKTDLTKLILALCFIILGMESWRHVPLFVIAAVPLLSEQIYPLISRSLIDFAKSPIMHIAVWAMAGIVLVTNLHIAVPALAGDKSYAERFGFPYGAIEYLKQSLPPQKLLNEYNWGGYLIWKYPEAKVFIDGRMAIWTDGEVNIFREFQTALGNNPAQIRQKLDEWQIDTVLTYANQPINQVLKDEGWSLEYRDALSTVWQLKAPAK